MTEVIKITRRAYNDIKRTVGLHEPETIALLGGRLGEDPNLITEVRFCRPMERSGSHIVPDADLANFTILDEWEPQGLYVLGAVHSHPGGIRRPSQGDIIAFRGWLESDDAIATGWSRFLAPIVTFDQDENMHIDWWFFDRGDTKPTKASVQMVENEESSPKQEASEMKQPNVTSNKDVPLPQKDKGIAAVARACMEFAQQEQAIRQNKTLNWIGKSRALKNLRRIEKAWLRRLTKHQLHLLDNS